MYPGGLYSGLYELLYVYYWYYVDIKVYCYRLYYSGEGYRVVYFYYCYATLAVYSPYVVLYYYAALRAYSFYQLVSTARYVYLYGVDGTTPYTPYYEVLHYCLPFYRCGGQAGSAQPIRTQ